MPLGVLIEALAGVFGGNIVDMDGERYGSLDAAARRGGAARVKESRKHVTRYYTMKEGEAYRHVHSIFHNDGCH
jgi:hypothetical protein